MDAKSVVEQVASGRNVSQVFWVACGGSLIDLYPAHFMLMREGRSIVSYAYTAEEFNLYTPARLDSDSIVIVCSHSGKTPECLRAAEAARQAGAGVVALTYSEDSPMAEGDWTVWIYPWAEDVPQSEEPAGIALLLAANILENAAEFNKMLELNSGLATIDGILSNARAGIRNGFGDKFVAFCKENPFFYILGSGPNFAQTYGFSICSLMEMQWQNCAYVHSGEYFHGPLEVTDENAAYFIQMGSGKGRSMDERALSFIEARTDKVLVVDSLDFGMGDIDESVRDYLDPIFFYMVNVQLRNARGDVFDHDPDYRRYMGKVEY